MHRLPGQTTLGALVLVALAPMLPGQEPSELEELARRPLRGSIRREQVSSRCLGRKVACSVYLPPAYLEEAERRFPLVLLLHDLFADEWRWVRRAGPQLVEDEILAGHAAPCVVVSPAGEQGFWIDGARGRRNRWRSFLLEDLLPHLEKTYRLEEGREGRFVIGLGMGGYGALSLAFSHPEAFAGVAAEDPLIFAEDPDALSAEATALLGHRFVREAAAAAFGAPIDRELWTRNHPIALARNLEPGKLRIAFRAGADPVYDGAAASAELHRLLAGRGIEASYEVREGPRGWESFREYLPRMLRYLAGTTTSPEVESRKRSPAPNPR